LSQSERNTALQSLRDGRARVCIATDVAARGLDLPDLELVIHADLPTNKASLLHRSGRTGRAGRKGICLLLVPHSRRRRAEMLLSSANIAPVWDDPPTSGQILIRDQERLLADPILTEPPLEEDIALGRELLARAGPEALAAALIRLFRAGLPSPEQISAPPAPSPVRATHAPREPVPFERRADGAAMTWFRAGVGRKNNADPKWLIPLLCRLGGITKQEIGAIRIFDRETKFEIAAHAAERFAAAVRATENNELIVAPTTPPGAGPARDPGPRPAKSKPARPARSAEAKPNEHARRKKNKTVRTR
jgi:ATP-dependent RNA helicase DeaD